MSVVGRRWRRQGRNRPVNQWTRERGSREGWVEGETKAADDGEAEFRPGLFSDKSQHIQW